MAARSDARTADDVGRTRRGRQTSPLCRNRHYRSRMNSIIREATVSDRRLDARSVACAVVIATASLTFQCATGAEIAERPDWKIGDKWQYHARTDVPRGESDWSREVRLAMPDGKFRVETEA